jgi:hypothetical protein
MVTNACGNSVNCGGCGGGNNVCQGTTCVCQPYDPCGIGCGQLDDGCGNLVYCDNCMAECSPYFGYCTGDYCQCEFW